MIWEEILAVISKRIPQGREEDKQDSPKCEEGQVRLGRRVFGNLRLTDRLETLWTLPRGSV